MRSGDRRRSPIAHRPSTLTFLTNPGTLDDQIGDLGPPRRGAPRPRARCDRGASGARACASNRCADSGDQSPIAPTPAFAGVSLACDDAARLTPMRSCAVVAMTRASSCLRGPPHANDAPLTRTAWASPAHLGTVGFAATVLRIRPRPPKATRARTRAKKRTRLSPLAREHKGEGEGCVGTGLTLTPSRPARQTRTTSSACMRKRVLLSVLKMACGQALKENPRTHRLPHKHHRL